MSDRELSFHLKLIGVKKYKLKLFIDLDIVPNGLVFRMVARSSIVSQLMDQAFRMVTYKTFVTQEYSSCNPDK